MTVFAVTSSSKDIFAFSEILEDKGWRIDRQSNPDSMHFIVNPTHAPVVEEFLEDLEEAYDRAPGREAAERRTIYGVSSVVEISNDIDAALLDDLEARYAAGERPLDEEES